VSEKAAPQGSGIQEMVVFPVPFGPTMLTNRHIINCYRKFSLAISQTSPPRPCKMARAE
jgi:hypothetical protein